ncbi:Homeobox protein SIX5 [Chelonia mydas]|uniref:Homeobox protein SIX5 n=1 Tax=Chelonia mydas TaxID=8469 RepID=M7AQV5_CHEMY|nr:Homeobox protein SIX5 [Chelonia mydas]
MKIQTWELGQQNPGCSESDGNPSTEDESSRGLEETELAVGTPAGPDGAGASGNLFLPAPAGASSILLNGNFITTAGPQAMLLNSGSVYSVPQGAPAPQLLSVPQGSQLISLPQVVPTSQVVTLQQGVGPIQIRASAAPLKVGAPQAAGGTVGQSNVHLINANVGVTTLQLPAGAPGNFLLTNPVPGGGTILTGMTLQQGKLILTATFPATMLMSPVLSAPAGSLALPIKQETAPLTATSAPIPGPVNSEGAGAGQPALAFGADGVAGRQPGILSNFPQEGLVLSPLPQPAAWPGSAGMEMQAAGTEGLFEMEKGAVEVLDGTEPSGLLLPEGEGLLLGSSGSDPLDPEGLDSDEKVLTQLQSVPVEEPLDL